MSFLSVQRYKSTQTHRIMFYFLLIMLIRGSANSQSGKSLGLMEENPNVEMSEQDHSSRPEAVVNIDRYGSQNNLLEII